VRISPATMPPCGAVLRSGPCESASQQHFGIGGLTGLAWKATSRMRLKHHRDVDTLADSPPTWPRGGHTLIASTGAAAIGERKLY
jgi:hypothetical protein